MIRYQERFRFYLNRIFKLIQNVSEQDGCEWDSFSEDEFNKVAWVMFDMAFNNFMTMNPEVEDWSKDDLEQVFLKKKDDFSEKISDIVSDLILNKHP